MLVLAQPNRPAPGAFRSVREFSYDNCGLHGPGFKCERLRDLLYPGGSSILLLPELADGAKPLIAALESFIHGKVAHRA